MKHGIAILALGVAILAAGLAMMAKCAQDSSVEEGKQRAGSRRFDRVTFCNHSDAERRVTFHLLKHPPDPQEEHEWCPKFSFTVGPMRAGSRLFSLPESPEPDENVWKVVCTVDDTPFSCTLFPDDPDDLLKLRFRSGTFWLGPRLDENGGETGEFSLVGHGVMSNDRVGRHMEATGNE